MTSMRILAILLNCGLLASVCSVFAQEGNGGASVMWSASLLVATPILNLIVLVVLRDGNWLTLYLRRKGVLIRLLPKSASQSSQRAAARSTTQGVPPNSLAGKIPLGSSRISMRKELEEQSLVLQKPGHRSEKCAPHRETDHEGLTTL